MLFEYHRTIRFQDTDAAGVVYFAQILSLCHEAYEASLQAAEMDVTAFFSRGAIAVPIIHTEADFRRPLMCGDVAKIQLMPQQTEAYSFEIRYKVLREKTLAATALTRHVCIDTASRQRHPLTPDLLRWLQSFAASASDAAPSG